jgi:hypothetical protein
MKYLLFIVVLVVVVITAGCVNPEPRSYPNSKITPTPTVISCDNWAIPTKCNGICYNSYQNDCCEGKIYPREKVGGSHTGNCCGGKWYPGKWNYNPCCAGEMYAYDGVTACCPVEYTNEPYDSNISHSLYNTSTQHCCAGKVLSGGIKVGNMGDNWEDCGDTCFDHSTQSCCVSGSEVNKPNYIVKQGYQVCCKDKPKLEGWCCNADTGEFSSEASGACGPRVNNRDANNINKIIRGY